MPSRSINYIRETKIMDGLKEFFFVNEKLLLLLHQKRGDQNPHRHGEKKTETYLKVITLG